MMVSEAVISWLNLFKPADISIDSLGAVSISYGLFKAPVQNVKKDILGNRIFTDHYTYMVRMDNLTETDMAGNQKYMQELTDWIEEQDEMKNYPDLDRAECIGISVSTPAHIGYTEERTSIYEMTISIKYRKEKQ